MAIIAGLTGGIASGKSKAAATFRAHNIPTIDADQIARDVVVPNSIGLSNIADTFGHDYLKTDGCLNRLLLAQLVFNDPIALQKLNAIMFPLIASERDKRINILLDAGHSIIIWDASLILENGNDKQFYPIIVVHCEKEAQIKRLMKRNSISREAANQIIDCQMSTKDKVSAADFLIDTNGSIQNSINQTKIVIKHLKGIS